MILVGNQSQRDGQHQDERGPDQDVLFDTEGGAMAANHDQSQSTQKFDEWTSGKTAVSSAAMAGDSA
jgi:hypothetical protein